MRNLHIGIDRISTSRLQQVWLLILALFFTLSCKRNDTIEQEQLYGRWEITKAERNGKETNYLRRGYFLFDENGTMTMNITGEDEKGTYTMENNKLLVGNKDFELIKLVADTMIMKYVTGPNSQFVFYMQKKQ